MKKKPLFKFLFAVCLSVALIVPSLLSACSCVKVKEGRLVIAMTGNPNELAPMKMEKLVQASLGGMVWETLVMKMEDGSYDPWLAESWDVSASKLEWTFNIDPDAKYSDGTDVTATDVKYAFDIGKTYKEDPKGYDHWSQTVAAWAQIDTITVVNPKTIKFTLSETFGTFLDSVCSVFIYPKAIWEDIEDPDNHDTLANYMPAEAVRQEVLIGSGPFKFKEYKADQWYWVERNDDYWKGDVNITDIVVNIYGNSEQALTALKTGEVDALQMIESPSEVAVLKKALDDNIEVDILEEFNHTCFFGLNLRTPPFHILEVRQAIDKAIDRADIIEYSQYGYANMPNYAPMASGLPDSNPNIAVPATYGNAASITAANELLDDVDGMSTIAGGVDGVRTYDADDGRGPQELSFKVMYVGTSPGYEVAADLVREDMAEIGIELTLDPVQSSTLGRTLFSGAFVWDFDTYVFGYGGGPEFEGLVRQWGNEPWNGNYDGSVIGWNNDPNRSPGDGSGGRPMTYATPYDTPTAADEALYLEIYNTNKAASADMIEACQDSRRLAVDSAAYHSKALEVQQMFKDKLPVPILYHGFFMTAYRTDEWTGWGDPETGGPEGTYVYGMCVPTMSLPTLLNLEPV